MWCILSHLFYKTANMMALFTTAFLFFTLWSFVVGSPVNVQRLKRECRQAEPVQENHIKNPDAAHCKAKRMAEPSAPEPFIIANKVKRDIEPVNRIVPKVTGIVHKPVKNIIGIGADQKDEKHDRVARSAVTDKTPENAAAVTQKSETPAKKVSEDVDGNGDNIRTQTFPPAKANEDSHSKGESVAVDDKKILEGVQKTLCGALKIFC